MGKPPEEAPEKPQGELKYDLAYILPQWRRFHDHGLLPDPGGYDDQDADKMDDFALLTAWSNYHMHALTYPKDRRKNKRGREKVARFDELFGGQDREAS